MHWNMTIATLVGSFGACLASVTSQEASLPDITESVRVQLRAAHAEKLARTPVERKLESGLLYAAREASGTAAVPGVATIGSRIRPDDGGRLLVDIRAEPSPALRQAILGLGGQVEYESPRWKSIRASLPPQSLLRLAARDDVRRILKGHLPSSHTGSVTSEGVVAHKVDTASTAFGVDGSGIKIGVISDSADGSANAIALGDLPASFTVLPGRFGSGIGEGTAMSEIVHDMAPGAQIYFASANGGKAAFADSILQLFAAGCDIIVDDISYSNEWQFQDDEIGQAVNTVVTGGGLYFSASGNEGSLYQNNSTTWEGDFVDAGPGTGPLVGAGRIHDFGGSTYNTLLTGDSDGSLQWSDEYNSSANDYDLFVLDPSGSSIVTSSTDSQTGSEEPYEFVYGVQPGERIVVVRFGATAADRYLRLSFTGSPLQYATEGQTIGHAGTQNCICVASSDASAVVPGTFDNSSSTEISSSDGPHKKFYREDGTPITPGNFLATGGVTIATPALTAADGVVTTLPPSSGLNPFYGTSAAAPHAAAIAALVWQRNRSLTNAEVRSALESGCVDVELPGFDVNSGNGILMADLALTAVSPRPITYGCETAASGFGAPAVSITSGGTWLGTTFELTVANDSPTAASTTLGFAFYVPPASSMQGNITILGACWNLPLPSTGVFADVPASNRLQLAIPADPSLNGVEIEWQAFAFDTASTANIPVTSSRGLVTTLAM